MTQTSDRPMATEVPGVDLPGPSAARTLTDPTLEGDLAELRVVLDEHPFPTHQDDLLALLVARRVPARLASRLSRLSRTRTYESFDEVCGELRRGVATV